MGQYHIVGRTGAGSLIAEFLLREGNVLYTISFPSPDAVIAAQPPRAKPDKSLGLTIGK